MWEIIKRNEKTRKTLWISKDAEGHKVYAVTMDMDGVAIEPTHTDYYVESEARNDLMTEGYYAG